jgi:hypothetical protein
MVSKIGQRVAKGGQFPVQDCQNPWFAGVKNQIVAPEIAVNDRTFIACRNIGRQPFNKLCSPSAFDRQIGCMK